MLPSFASLFPSARVVLCLGAGLATVLGHSRENESPANHPSAADAALVVQAGWDSRYHAEGRDNLDGDSLWRGSAEWQRGPLALGGWYGYSPEQEYDEVQLSLALRQSFGVVDAYLGVTHLRFPFDGSHDNELGGGVVVAGLPLGIELAADAYHSFEADGWFAETTVTRGWEISDRLHAELSAVFGINQGYIADGHDGANHIALTFGVSYALTPNVALVAHATQSVAVDRRQNSPGDATLRDFFHGGVGIEWTF